MTQKTISLTPSQIKVVQSKAKYTAFVAGMGAGKSYVMGLIGVQHAAHGAGCVVGIYEKDHFLIKKVAMPSVMYWLSEFGYVGKPNNTDHTIETSSAGVGDFVFKTMDNPAAIIGFETSVALFDELDTLPLLQAEEIWQKAHGRNRLQPRGIDQKFCIEKNGKKEYLNRYFVFTTPEGFNFCYKHFHLSTDPDFLEIQGISAENPSATESWIESQIKTYGPVISRAYVYGEYVNMRSLTVYNAFDKIRNRSLEVVSKSDVLHIGGDFNVGKQCALIFVKRDGGAVHAVAELVNVKDTPTLINLIKTKYNNNQIIIYPDASGISRRTINASISDISLLQDAGFIIKAPTKNPFVRDRVQAMQTSFLNLKQFVNLEECPFYVECLLNQAYDVNSVPDKRSGYDHANDAAGYCIYTLFPIKRNVFDLNFSFVS